jgi:hypothetical protein
MLHNPLTQQMVLDEQLVKQADTIHNYFEAMISQGKNKPDTAGMESLGFQKVGKTQFIDQLNLNLALAKKYQDITTAYPGYLVVHQKHMLAWLLINNLFIGEHYQFTGLIPAINQDHITRFNNILRLSDCKIEYKGSNKWHSFKPADLKKLNAKLVSAKGQELHSVNGVRMKLGRSISSNGRYLTEANVRALPPYQMVADIKFFDKEAYITDTAKNATWFTPNPDPLVTLPIGEFHVIVTAWGHEEQLMPQLQKLATTSI